MRPFHVFKVIIVSLLIISGCASVETDREWADVKSRVQERTGQEILWEKSEKEAKIIKEEVNKLLKDGLTREEAIRIALINNRALQSTFEDIGISKSDLIQAGLFHNPSLSAIFRFPFNGGGTNIEIDGFFSLSDFWQIPFRKKVASVRLESTMRHVEQMVLETAREAKQSYDSVYYLRLALKETESILDKFQEISAEVVTRKAFGLMTDLDLYMSKIIETEAIIALQQTKSDHTLANAKLARVLGLNPDQTGYHLLGDPEDDLPPLPDGEQAAEYALQNRLDVQIAQLKINEAERKRKLEKSRILREVDIGASYEREVDGDEIFGPGVSIQLPLFDQNQAQIAKADFLVQKATKRRRALEGQIREEIAGDLSRIDLHYQRIRLFKEKIIPNRVKALAYAQKWVGTMQLNRLYLLEAQRGILNSQVDYLNARMEFRHAIADFELHLGGKLPTVR